jgi:hypothetical protein
MRNFCACDPRAWGKWENFVAWENLKEVTLTCPSVILSAGNRLHGLEKLQITAFGSSKTTYAMSNWNHDDKISIERMLRLLGAGLKELQFCGRFESFDPDYVRHLQSLRTLSLLGVFSPKGRQHAPQLLAKVLNLSELHHPHLKQVTIELPYSPVDVDQVF